MENVIVSFPTSRDVYVDGERNGRTGDSIRVDAGTHRFDLGSPQDYEPEYREVAVSDTTVLDPMEIVFTEKDA